MKKARFKQETKRQEEERAAREKEEKGLNREKWKGIRLGPDGKPIAKVEEEVSDVKAEEAVPAQATTTPLAEDASGLTPETKPALDDEDTKPKVEQNSLFKKRRPLNANRSTRQK